MTQLPEPLSRRDRQRQTREALVFAARAAFARDGYSGANLDVIAREAGFSKGAVYSNFESKADLFLAVMDANMDTATAEGGFDVLERPSADQAPPELIEAMKGFALATLEFVATAARDEALAPLLAERIQRVTQTFASAAAGSRAEGETLTDAELSVLLVALDQGAALLNLAGSVAIDQRLLQAGMRRLLRPAVEENAEDPADDGGSGHPALHHREIQRRIAGALWTDGEEPAAT